ncbi:MAG: cupin domain-containing protein [Anaerolineae bacterium]|nr:cupin domain-containing protein [Anaerolineae bacterium]
MPDDKFFDETVEMEEFKKKHPNVGIHFKNLKTFPAHFRPVRRTSGAHFDLADYKTIEAHISEIPPGGHNQKHRHMNEAIIYIVCGRGHSIIQPEGGPEQRIDWEEGDMFAPPLNWWHQHFNDDPEKPARYLAFTNIGLMKKLGLFTKESAKE